MTIPLCDRNHLLVEGMEERFLIPELVEKGAGCPWGDYKHRQHPVEIHSCDGIDGVLNPKRISATLKIPNLEALGVIVDSNGDMVARWQQVRNRFLSVFPLLPPTMLPGGLIESNAAGLRLGVWIMPDNQSGGMLESLLQQFVPANQAVVVEYARQVVVEARSRGAPAKSVHLAKAEIHSWLAWQDPPGLQLHEAVRHFVLEPASPLARPFLDWFLDLYQLRGLISAQSP